jgi:chemotaxis protein histidine kinase CheA
MAKFRQRLSEADPVSGNPRYGEKTRERVRLVLQAHDELECTLRLLYKDDDNEDDNHNNRSSESAVLAALQHQAALEEAANREARRRVQEAEEAAVLAAARAEEARQEATRVAEAAAQELLRRQQQAEATQALQAIAMERQAVSDAARADQEWQASIPRGGVRDQLVSLLQATTADPAAQRTALNALHTIFCQIVAHPEDVKFRRIRRNHAQFDADIGRHVGGREVLIAAGFRLGAIDDVPSFISTEPDIAKDMDGWSAWFDLLKETLAVIEEALIQL